MARYRRARADYPTGVVAIYDNGGASFDRYTVVYKPYQCEINLIEGIGLVWPYVGMSANPFWPQGFCQHGEVSGRRPALDGCDKVIRFEDLPPDCQKVVLRDTA